VFKPRLDRVQLVGGREKSVLLLVRIDAHDPKSWLYQEPIALESG